jgi:hypothetical protein
VELRGLSEASGLAASRRTPGRFWAHNDSGQPFLFALDSSGAVTGRVRVTGATVDDWEAIAVGPCASGSCIHIGDIGDNDASRQRITIFRLPEPEAATGTAAVADVFHATYPDGAHNAETLLTASGRLYVVTKAEKNSRSAVYRFPSPMRSGAPMRLERVGAASSPLEAGGPITDGSVSADGQWVVLRSRSALAFYRASELLAGQWRAVSTVDVARVGERQGEGIAFGANDTVFLAGEGGNKQRPGTFARLSCALAGS